MYIPAIMEIIPAHSKLRQEDYKFKSILIYIERLYFTKNSSSNNKSPMTRDISPFLTELCLFCCCCLFVSDVMFLSWPMALSQFSSLVSSNLSPVDFLCMRRSRYHLPHLSWVGLPLLLLVVLCWNFLESLTLAFVC